MDSEYLRLSNRINKNEKLLSAQGAGTFLGLTDTPDSYGTNSGKLLTVNSSADGLSFSPVTGSGTLMPVGSMLMWTSSAIPAGWLLCDGAAVSRTTYEDLFTKIGTTYGNGDGSTTFNLPNLKGRFPIGLQESDTDFDALGKTGGSKTHTLKENELPAHSHSISHDHGLVTSGDESQSHTHYHNHGSVSSESSSLAYTSLTTAGRGEYNAPYSCVISGVRGSHSHSVNLPGITSNSNSVGHTHSINLPNYSGNSGSSGSSSAHNNMPPFITVNFIINYQDVKIPFKGDKGDTGETGASGATGPAGADAPNVQYQFSSNGTEWHSSFTAGDSYIHFSTDGGSTWGDTILFKGETGDTGPQGEQGIQGETGAVGVSMRNMGSWNSSTEYENNSTYIDVVEHNGSGYMCKLTASNQEPPNAVYWELLASKGDTGETGETGATGATGVSMRSMGSWDSVTEYVNDSSYIDVVQNNGSSYACKATHTNQEPPNASYWELLASKGTDGTGSGDVTGPAGSSDEHLAVFESTTGKVIKDGGQTLAELTAAIKLAIYPVGSIYTSVDATSPASLFGGTWQAFGEGKALVGFKSGDSDFGTPEGTCGAKTHTLTESEMPSHIHVQNSHSHTINHDHGSFTSGSQSANHTHSFSDTSSSAGGHYHEIWWGTERPVSLSSGDKDPYGVYSSSGYRTGYSSGSVYAGAMNSKAVGDHTHSVSGTTGSNSAGHTHSVNPPSYSGSSGSVAAVNQSTGGNGAHNNLQPSITVYMWKRTA